MLREEQTRRRLGRCAEHGFRAAFFFSSINGPVMIRVALTLFLAPPVAALAADGDVQPNQEDCAAIAKPEPVVRAMTVAQRNAMLDEIASCYDRRAAAKKEADAKLPKEKKGVNLWD